MPGDAEAVEQFSRPDRAVDFMRGALVMPPSISAPLKYGRAMDLTLIPMPWACALGGDTIKCYAVAMAEGGDPSFKSYICPYTSGELSYAVLAKEADFCFTFAMDGCTFGVGTPTPTGEVIVSHGNAIGVTEGTGDQENKQKEFATQFHRFGLKGLLEPSTYRLSKKHISTTVGVRVGGKWKFYSLRYVRTKDTYPLAYEHLGVHKFA